VTVWRPACGGRPERTCHPGLQPREELDDMDQQLELTLGKVRELKVYMHTGRQALHETKLLSNVSVWVNGHVAE
jgi:hypothetical protein